MENNKKRYDINQVFQMLGSENLIGDKSNVRDKSIEVDGYKVRVRSLRYMTFYQKGTRCVCCGKEGTYFQLDGDNNTNRRHFNLYCEDGTLMTKDHVIPKSREGKDTVSNMQPMCSDCNLKKGNSLL